MVFSYYLVVLSAYITGKSKGVLHEKYLTSPLEGQMDGKS